MTNLANTNHLPAGAAGNAILHLLCIFARYNNGPAVLPPGRSISSFFI